VQTIIPLDAKTALRLTTALLIYTPSGTSIQGLAIKGRISVSRSRVRKELRGRCEAVWPKANCAGHIQGENEDGKGARALDRPSFRGFRKDGRSSSEYAPGSGCAGFSRGARPAMSRPIRFRAIDKN